MSEENSYKMWCKRIEQRSSDTMTKIMRMKAIQGFMTKVKYAKMLSAIQSEKTLIFSEATSHADFISDKTYHSKNKKSELNLQQFINGEILTLSSVQQLSEGINIPNLRVGIILHSYANEKKLPQKIGRFLRLNPNQTAIIHILVYQDTIDMTWLKAALKEFDKTKIFSYDIRKTIGDFQKL